MYWKKNSHHFRIRIRNFTLESSRWISGFLCCRVSRKRPGPAGERQSAVRFDASKQTHHPPSGRKPFNQSLRKPYGYYVHWLKYFGAVVSYMKGKILFTLVNILCENWIEVVWMLNNQNCLRFMHGLICFEVVIQYRAFAKYKMCILFVIINLYNIRK